MNIYLTGFMGTGKSTVGKQLATRLDLPFLDMDAEIAKREGLTIPQIFSGKGEAYFREAESKLLAELSASSGLVVSTGGGLVTKPGNIDLMKQTGFMIGLQADREVIFERVSKQTGRPLLAGSEMEQRIDSLLKERKKFYDTADIQLDTSCRDVADIVADILNHPLFPLR